MGAGSSKEPDCLETNGSELLDLIKYQAREIINVGGKDETVGLGAKTGLLYLVPFTSVFCFLFLLLFSSKGGKKYERSYNTENQI